MGIEFELKYKLTEAILSEVLRAYPGPWQKIAMETTYFDTDSGDLSYRRYTLRKRLENGIPVCTVKTPEKDGERGEWEVEEPDIDVAIPKLCKLGAPEDLLTLTRAGVAPVCGARFTRHACSILLEDAAVELALDQGVLFAGDVQTPLCELEVELKSGSREAAVSFAQSLVRKYALQPEQKSKFRRARDLKEEK